MGHWELGHLLQPVHRTRDGAVAGLLKLVEVAGHHFAPLLTHHLWQARDSHVAVVFSLLACIMKIVAHMVGLQERMNGPRYDVFGPWPHAPAHIVAAYP